MSLSTGFTTQDVSGMIVVCRTLGPLTGARVVAILTTYRQQYTQISSSKPICIRIYDDHMI